MHDLVPALKLARTQHGVVARWQLRDAGLSDRGIARYVDDGLLERVHPGVYVVRSARRTFEHRAMVAVLAAGGLRPGGPMVAVARRSAAHLLGLEPTAPLVVQVVVDHARTPRLARIGARAHRSVTLLPEDVVDVDGVPVTRASRTCADLAMTHPAAYVIDVTARALQRRLTDLGQLSDQFSRAGRIPGARTLRVALSRLALDATQAESAPEERVWQLIVRAGLPRPIRQFTLRDADGNVRRLDLAYPDRRIAIEVDGYWWHSRPGSKLDDEVRQNALINGGWLVLRFSPGHSDDYIVNTIAAALA